MLVLFMMLGFGGYHFSDATVYDPSLNSLREGIHIQLNERGLVEMTTDKPLPEKEGYDLIKNAVILPHFSDFYSLVQERGLGFDENINGETQGRMAHYLISGGFYGVRDPVFPNAGLEPVMSKHLKVFAQRGYVEVRGGPAQQFSLVLDPKGSPSDLDLPEEGPVTLWWTEMGTEQAVLWPQYPDLVNDVISFFHSKNRKVGCYIQDASATAMERLYPFPFDFYEGIPGGEVDVAKFPNVVWIPLASLNDKRYCARNLDKGLARAGEMKLYGSLDISRAEAKLDQVRQALADRCGIWKKRRDDTLKPLKDWIEKGGALGVGSSGGHMFAFTGDIRTELDLLEGLGASQPQLLKALFQTNPELLGLEKPYLKPGKPANFIVFQKGGFWGRLVGEKVDLNFVDGKPYEAKVDL